MAALPTILTRLAHRAAAESGFTARRWVRDQVDLAILRVEVERRLLGVRPAVTELMVALPNFYPVRSSPSLLAPRRLPPGRGKPHGENA